MDGFTEFNQWLPFLFLLAGLGITAGLLAGLTGIGGGIVLVPGLYYAMTALGFDPAHLMHMAVGTSLAVMVPTGLSSARAHWKKGAVDTALLRRMGIGVLLGVLAGTMIADRFSGDSLHAFFAVMLACLALIMVSNPGRYAFRDSVPGQPWAGMAGAVIGIISTLMGIGGATMNVPYLSLHKVPMHRAVATSAAQGLLISIPGLVGFVIIGWHAAGMPPLTVGYINLAAFALIAPFSVVFAPLGARLAHGLPVTQLRQVFAVLLLLISARMLWEVFGGR